MWPSPFWETRAAGCWRNGPKRRRTRCGRFSGQAVYDELVDYSLTHEAEIGKECP